MVAVCFFVAVAAQVQAQEAVVQPVTSVQQQQAEQMRVYWKVCPSGVFLLYTHAKSHVVHIVH